MNKLEILTLIDLLKSSRKTGQPSFQEIIIWLEKKLEQEKIIDVETIDADEKKL